MRSSKITQFFILVICALLLVSCSGSSASSPTIQVDENNVDMVSFEETIRINNCGNLTDSEQTKERSFSTSIEGTAELGVNYQVIEGSVSAKYGQYRSVTTSQRLTAAPNTNMEFVLRWSEEVRAGNVTVNGRTGSYSVRIPIAVEQVSSRDLGCPGGVASVTNPTSPAVQPQPTTSANTSTSKNITVMGSLDWQHTDIAVDTGDRLVIEYISGQWSIYPPWGYAGPEGYDSSFPLNPDYPMPNVQPATLIGKIGQSVFKVGERLDMIVQESGRLYLRMNDNKVVDNDGSLQIQISVIAD
jgi:hypothetical protein